jgi:excisionase family DNA binding protein
MHRSDSPENGSIPARRVYGVPEVAALLGGVTVRYVWTLIASGALESVKIGKRRMVPHEAIDALIAQLREDEARARAAVATHPPAGPHTPKPPAGPKAAITAA